MSLKPVWSTDQVLGQPELCRETLPRKNKQANNQVFVVKTSSHYAVEAGQELSLIEITGLGLHSALI